ncbi:MAG: hypothetical protein DRP78_06770 [Candidatus Omnitrophota bacterium]|nr:MAG: hypothetical protein DRP78_06770 [Candidatus Omnitrophota bacterium]
MLLYFFYRLGRFIARILPVYWGYAIANFLARVKYIFAVEERVSMEDNLRVILGTDAPCIPEYIKVIYSNFCKYLVDFFRSERIDQKFLDKFIQVQGIESMDEALAKGNGVLGFTAHIGNWELCAQILSVLGYKMNALALPHSNSHVNNFFDQQRKVTGVKVIAVGKSIRKCFSALKRNEIVGILGDKDFSGINGVYVDFFSKKMLMPRGPAVLSLRTNAAIVPGFVIRDEKNSRKFKYIFEKPIYPVRTGDENKDIEALTQKLAKIIEKYVRKYPQQWFAFNRFWEA